MTYLTITLAALLVVVSALLFQSCKRVINEPAVNECIMTRVSVRAYTADKVSETQIEKMLRAGMAAPSAVNKQPWHFIVVTEQVQLDALAEVTPNAKMAAAAPLAIVVCGDMSKTLEGEARDFWIQDCSAATQNILLEAHALGLGAVWTGTWPALERCAAVAQVLDIPEGIVPFATIVIGHPAGENKPKDKWNPRNVSWEKYGVQK
jgi:nitroreductase